MEKIDRIKNIIGLLETAKEEGIKARIVLTEDLLVDFNESRLIVSSGGQKKTARTISESTLFPGGSSSEANPLKGLEIIEDIPEKLNKIGIYIQIEVNDKFIKRYYHTHDSDGGLIRKIPPDNMSLKTLKTFLTDLVGDTNKTIDEMIKKGEIKERG